VILTLDLGTTSTKAVLWDDGGPVAVGRGLVATASPQPGWAEQDPEDWWRAVVSACAAAATIAGRAAWRQAGGAVFSSARETLVPVDASGHALRPALLWSDRRAGDQAAARCAAGGGVEALRQVTGVVVDAGATAAKADWLAAQEPDVLARTRWLLGPRDLIVQRLTGNVATDVTLASRTGWYAIDGGPVSDAPSALLPPVLASTAIAGELLAEPAAALDLPAGLPIVLGAGDRACEVLGVGAGAGLPMVSWGTTANVSLAVSAPPPALPPGVALSAGALSGHLLECGLSAAGAALDWLAVLTGRSPMELADQAVGSPPGARGVVATCWFNGARAPWWDPTGRAAFLGLSVAHGPADLARALIEAVAFDVARSLDALGQGRGTLAAAGAGGALDLWTSVLGGVTGCRVERRRTELAASAGALLVAGAALGLRVDLDAVNPVADVVAPDPAAVAQYRTLRSRSDRVAHRVLEAGL